MKLLFDENLSPKLPSRLSDIFPNSLHVRDVDMKATTDPVENLLRREFSTVKLFYEDSSLSLLALP